jgi:hypothetical protein
MKLRYCGLAVVFALAFGTGCEISGDDDDDGESQGEGSGPSTQGSTEAGSETQNAETGTPTSDPTADTAETGSPEDTGASGDSGETTADSDSLDDGDTGMGGLSPECDALCAHTPTALDAEADCVAAMLNKLGGHAFEEPSCEAFTDAFDAGTATIPMCEQCYLDAGVAADHCTVAEDMCFFFP